MRTAKTFYYLLFTMAATATALNKIPLTGHTFGTPLVLKKVPGEDVPAIAAMEIASYPEDEAATPEGLTFRQANAGDFFWGCYRAGSGGAGGGEVDASPVGFICGTLTSDATLTHDSMATHVPGSESLCVHSVCVGAEHRRKAMKQYT